MFNTIEEYNSLFRFYKYANNDELIKELLFLCKYLNNCRTKNDLNCDLIYSKISTVLIELGTLVANVDNDRFQKILLNELEQFKSRVEYDLEKSKKRREGSMNE
ncbi:MAG: hypothetical protein ACOCQD_02695 [archaeon]